MVHIVPLPAAVNVGAPGATAELPAMFQPAPENVAGVCIWLVVSPVIPVWIAFAPPTASKLPATPELKKLWLTVL
jgi:hypothetical protein